LAERAVSIWRRPAGRGRGGSRHQTSGPKTLRSPVVPTGRAGEPAQRPEPGFAPTRPSRPQAAECRPVSFRDCCRRKNLACRKADLSTVVLSVMGRGDAEGDWLSGLGIPRREPSGSEEV
jgi:hypothetical protein